MLKNTVDAVTALLRCDPTITPEQSRAALDALEGKTSATYTDPTPIDRTLSRATVAEILGVSTRTVTLYAKRGIIRPCRFGADGKRAVGYSEKSVRDALAKRNTQGDGAAA